MDFEEQLEKAEKSPYPSLVGASVKSADDSPHKNYIHPEKYTGKSKSKPGKKSLLSSSVSASLDDLISEGALLGSEEDFDRFLDNKGNVLSDAKFSKEKTHATTPDEKPAHSHKPGEALPLNKPSESIALGDNDAAVLSPMDSNVEEVSQPSTKDTSAFAGLENYLTPNLSEYQIGHQISDHAEMLNSVTSFDLSKLPTADDNESRSKTTEAHPSVAAHKPVRPSNLRSNSAVSSNKLEFGQNVQVSATDSLHAPYFQSDDRSTSRSMSRVPYGEKGGSDRSRSRSRSRSVMAPHLARGDNYKNTHDEAPSKYELPADFNLDEEAEEPEDRRLRQSKPTLGDSIAAAEAKKESLSDIESVTRDPSLVTSGDYTNFNADGHDNILKGSNLYSLRSQSSTNYLRSISRSRSRKPAHDKGGHSTLNEKNDSNTQELEREGALVSDDPYSQVENLETMMAKVLKDSAEKSKTSSAEASRKPQGVTASGSSNSQDISSPSKSAIEPQPSSRLKDIEEAGNSSVSSKEQSRVDLDVFNKDTGSKAKNETSKTGGPEKPVVNDVAAEEKEAEATDQLLAEKAPTVSAKDINVNQSPTDRADISIPYAEEMVTEKHHAEEQALDISAEEKEREAADQIKAKEAPVLSASDIHVDGKTEGTPAVAPADASDSLVKNADKPSSKLPTKEVAEKSDDNLSIKEASSAVAPGGTVKESAKGELILAIPTTTKAGSEETTKDKPEVESTDALEKSEGSPKISSQAAKKEVDGLSISKESLKEPSLVGDKKNVASEAAIEKIEIAEKPTNMITEPDNILVGKSAAEVSTKSTMSSKFTENVKASENAKFKEEDDDEFEVSAEELRKHLESLPVYLYTSLAGGMQIITRTNRLATILQANGIKFEHKDLGTDEEAKKIWKRYAQGKTLPGVVRGDDFIGNWEFIEEVNEDYRLKEVLHETL